MASTLSAYLPQDRCEALFTGQTLPDRTHGAALFADISGFTALTEQLTHNLGSVAHNQSDLSTARLLLEEGLALHREMGNKRGTADALTNLRLVVNDQGDYMAAHGLLEEGLALQREMGDKPGIASSLNNLGHVTTNLGNPARARALYQESLTLNREMGDKFCLVGNLIGLAEIACHLGVHVRATRLAAAAETLRAAIQVALDPVELRKYITYIYTLMNQKFDYYLIDVESGLNRLVLKQNSWSDVLWLPGENRFLINGDEGIIHEFVVHSIDDLEIKTISFFTFLD